MRATRITRRMGWCLITHTWGSRQRNNTKALRCRYSSAGCPRLCDLSSIVDIFLMLSHQIGDRGGVNDSCDSLYIEVTHRIAHMTWDTHSEWKQQRQKISHRMLLGKFSVSFCKRIGVMHFLWGLVGLDSDFPRFWSCAKKDFAVTLLYEVKLLDYSDWHVLFFFMRLTWCFLTKDRPTCLKSEMCLRHDLTWPPHDLDHDLFSSLVWTYL